MVKFKQIAIASALLAMVSSANSTNRHEAIQACIAPMHHHLTPQERAKIAACLGFVPDASGLCLGQYSPINVPHFPQDEIHFSADQVILNPYGRSTFKGNVIVSQNGRLLSAETAYVIRDKATQKVTEIELFAPVVVQESDRLMIASKAKLQPQEKTGQITQVLYRLNPQYRKGAILPAWGRSSYVERFANENYLLKNATYTTCAPTDRAWHIEAKEITLDKANESGLAKHAYLKVHDVPVLYTPVLSFPYTEKRKSGFLMPTYGYSNIGGYDLALPYYWNIAPNYDATLLPHLYTTRGFMLGADARYLTEKSSGEVIGHFLPQDKAYGRFLKSNEAEYPWIAGSSTDRWSLWFRDKTNLSSKLQMNVDYKQVSDDYYLQDFSSNLAVLTERQLLKQGDISYTGENWLFKGMVQGYQTLQPFNQTPVDDAYQRLPQLFALGHYDDLPFSTQVDILGQLDVFQWPGHQSIQPQGPRWHFAPSLTQNIVRPWGYLAPSLDIVENHYNVSYSGVPNQSGFNRLIPRYSLDSGLYLERKWNWGQNTLTQTLEPRVFYLNVPYANQAEIPVFDSGYMIFDTDQLFRKNRFSGFDRIGDANQLAYAISSRWLDTASSRERGMISVGQIKYFSNRRVSLCQSPSGYCIDSPLTLGYLSQTEGLSPIASHAGYYINSVLLLSGDYVWDPATRATNNGNLNLHYQPKSNSLLHLGYTYLVNGDLTQVAYNAPDNSALHQASVAFALPIKTKWSGLGAYQYNMSKGYSMMSLLGLQYDSCCWAMRFMGGRAFQSLSSTSSPKYNNSVYLQILLKGLGTVSSSNPSSTINTFIPGYQDSFRGGSAFSNSLHNDIGA